jgi:hypothetical protein
MAIVLQPRDGKFVIEIGSKKYGDHRGELNFGPELSTLSMKRLRTSKEASALIVSMI